MDDDVNEIDEHPGFGFVAAGRDGGKIALLAQLGDFVTDSTHLAGAGAGGDDEIIGDGGNIAEVEDDDVLAFGIGGQARGIEGKGASWVIAEAWGICGINRNVKLQEN